MSIKMLKKASPKTIMGQAIKAPTTDDSLYLFTIYGNAKSLSRGESTYGPWVALVGEFEGVNSDNERFMAPKAFLPEPMHGMIAGRLDGAEKGDSVEFAIKVNIVRSDSTVGYEYQAEPLVEPSESDSLAHLRRIALPATPVTLTTPAKEPEAKAKAKA